MDTSKYKKLYLQEAAGHISGIEEGLLRIEKEPSDEKAVDALFRHFHSLKGMSASMGYGPIKSLAHARENLLSEIRSKKRAVTPEVMDALFKSLDMIKTLLKCIEEDRPLEAACRPEQTKDAAEPALKLPSTMKVESGFFDDILATVGQLYMILGSFRALAKDLRLIEFKDGVHNMGKNLDRLHSEILAARMLPISDLTAGLPRIVRDISAQSGKKAALRVEGGSISVDRAILEDLGSPLVHIIRNSLDHGIEPPEERVRKGKPETGNIAVSAFEKRDRVVIEVSDDGRGIDVEKVKAKAIEDGMHPSEVSALGEREALMLVCRPGLSTAKTVTETSGRGVGMNAVKDVVEARGGLMFIDTKPGAGTTVTLDLPRTTSIIRALVVETGGEEFLVPISMIEKVVETESDAETIEYEGGNVPLVDLRRVLGIRAEGRKDRSAVLVVGPGGRGATGEDLRGIKVDNFGMEIEAYVKALRPPLASIWGVTGITIMGDGRPVFVLDVPQIAAVGMI